MPRTSLCCQEVRVDSLAIIANPQSKLPLIMTECVKRTEDNQRRRRFPSRHSSLTGTLRDVGQLIQEQYRPHDGESQVELVQDETDQIFLVRSLVPRRNNYPLAIASREVWHLIETISRSRCCPT